MFAATWMQRKLGQKPVAGRVFLCDYLKTKYRIATVAVFRRPERKRAEVMTQQTPPSKRSTDFPRLRRKLSRAFTKTMNDIDKLDAMPKEIRFSIKNRGTHVEPTVMFEYPVITDTEQD